MIATVTPNPCIDYNVQVDELLKNQMVRAKGALFFPGGNGVNVSRTVVRLGQVPVQTYGLAGGQMGALLKGMLDEEKVPHDFTDAGAGLETRVNLLMSLTPDRSLVRVNAAGPECDEKAGETLLKKIAALDPAPKILVLGGSLPGKRLPPGIPRDWYGRVIDEMKKKPEVKVVLDSRELALGHGVDRGPWLVKPNEVEMARLAGRKELTQDRDFVAAAETFIAKYGIEYFVISLGARGAIVVGKTERFKITPPEAVSLTRVGAGDAFVGGLVWSLAQGEPIDVAAKHAVAVGTATVLSPATELFRKEEVERLLPKTQVERI